MVEEKYKRTAREFFGGKRCVYRHEIQEQATEWHHLDEKRDPEFEKRFENIVPLNGADHNLLTYDPRLYRGSVDGGGLSWRGLLFVGGEKFAKGRFADSYGCSRLAASIVDPRRSETHHGFVGNAGHSVEACGWALSSLKQYSSNPHSLPLVKDVLDRDVLPTLANPNLVHGVPNAAIALVATEIQGLYRDYGLINDARR